MKNLAALQTQTKKAAAKKPPDQLFVKDQNGTTLFYPFGVGVSGYRVTSDVSEAALQEAADHYHALFKNKRDGAFRIFYTISLGIFSIFPTHPLLACSLLCLYLLAGFELDRILRRWSAGKSLASLPRAPAHKRTVVQQMVFWAICIGGFLVLPACLAGDLYDIRFAATADSHTTLYYSDIVPVLALSVIVASATWVLVDRWKPFLARHEYKMMLIVLVAAACTVGLAGDAAWSIAAAKPRIVIKPDMFSCGWRASWREVTYVTLTGTGWGKKFVDFTIDPSKTKPPLHRHSKSDEPRTRECQITGLNAGYRTVLKSIRTTWRKVVPSEQPQ